MKISGTHNEIITTTLRRNMSVVEKRTIKSITEDFAKEGKHIINISRGDVLPIFEGYRENITFVWEADDTDPVYIAALENAEKERKAEQIILEKKRKQKKAKQKEFVQKGLRPSIKIAYGILLGILGITMVGCFLFLYFEHDENILFVILSILGGIIWLVSFIFLYLKGCIEFLRNYL